MHAESISSLLDKMEGLLGRIGPGSGKQVLDLLLLMDEVSARIQEQEGRGAVLLAEKTQFASIQASIKKDAAQLLRELGGAAGLQAERLRHNVAETAWWWRLEQVVARDKKGPGSTRVEKSLGSLRWWWAYWRGYICCSCNLTRLT